MNIEDKNKTLGEVGKEHRAIPSAEPKPSPELEAAPRVGRAKSPGEERRLVREARAARRKAAVAVTERESFPWHENFESRVTGSPLVTQGDGKQDWITPGPWKFEHGFVVGCGEYLADLNYSELPETVRDHNGMMMAAAPLLYNALIAAHRYAHDGTCDGCMISDALALAVGKEAT